MSRMKRHADRLKNRFPPVDLCPPCDVMIFLMRKERGVKKLPLNRDILDHLPPEQRERAVGSEHFTRFRFDLCENGTVITKNRMPGAGHVQPGAVHQTVALCRIALQQETTDR